MVSDGSDHLYPDDLDYSEVNFIIHDWDLECMTSEFGTLETFTKFIIERLPNRLIHPEFNSKGIGRIRYLLTRARS